MFKVIAVAIAIAATTAVAGAQAPSASKAAVKPASQTATSTTRRHRRSMKKETQADLQKEAKIPESDARATALKEVANGTVKSEELEREKGKLIYSYDITVPGKTGVEEVNVNAIDGSVAGKMHESAKTEQKEAKQEAKAKTTKAPAKK
ncbi:MAG TPA: PepSY domain-containing protein [Gemmatimonadaceae bacterium]|nr:PepSY domain-containing protein [Gemmatimonadaceae bacterium]